MKGLSLMEEYRPEEYYKHYFRTHKATIITQNDQFVCIDWKNENENNSKAYYIRFLLDKEAGNLIISGDVGSAIVSWHGSKTVDETVSLTKDIHYFASKFACASDTYTYYWHNVLHDLNEAKEEYCKDHNLADKPDDHPYKEWVNNRFLRLQMALEAMEYEGQHYEEPVIIALQSIRSDWRDTNLAHLGRRISDRVWFWAIGWQMAVAQVRNQLIYHHAPIRIPLTETLTLTAEASTDPDFNEIYIGVEKDNVWHQDLAIVREVYEIDNYGSTIIHYPDEYEILLYSNPNSEDYTGDPVRIPLYKEPDEEPTD